MSTPNFWNFYFILDKTTYIWVDDSGAINTTTDESVGLSHPLNYAFENWPKIEIGYERSESLHGIFTSITGDYDAVGDGKKIVQYVLMTYGKTAFLELAVYKRNDNWTYDLWYKSQVSLGDGGTPIERTKVEISLFESGIGSDFKANLDTPVEIDMGNDMVSTLHFGTTVLGKYNFQHGETIAANNITRTNKNEEFNLLIVPISDEGLRPIAQTQTAESIRMGAFGSSSFYGISDPDFSDQYNRWIFQAGQEIKDVKISIESTYQWNFIEYPITAPGPATNCIFRLWVGVGYDRQPLRIFDLVYSGATIPLAANGVTYDEIVSVINYSLGTIYENERVYIVMGVFTDYPVLPSASAPWGMKIIPLNPELSRISIEVAFDSRETLVKGYRWYNMWEKVGSKLFGTKYGSTPFKSIYLSNPSTFVKGNYPYRTILTNGQLVKGAASAKTKISPKDLVEDAMANWPVGVGIIDDVIQIEHLSTFYDTSEVVYDFGELVDFKIESINNVKNTFVIGNKYDTLDTLNGVFDFNTVSTFKNAAILKGEGSTTLKSNFISSIYSIEKLRVAEYGKDITGSNISEDIFKYSVVGYETTLGDITYYGIRYAEVVPDEYYVYGVTWSETKYNVEFSPKNMYERVKWVINTNQKPSVLPFTFQKSDRYGGMYSLFYDTPNGIYFDEVYEDRDIVPNDDDLFFLPFKISGKAPLTTTLENIMTLNKYKMFACRCNGVYIEFFIDKITFTPYSKDTFDIEGRIAPTIDLNTLISL